MQRLGADDGPRARPVADQRERPLVARHEQRRALGGHGSGERDADELAWHRPRYTSAPRRRRPGAVSSAIAYAIVKTGGKQYRVEEGQTLVVERLPVDEGATVDLEPILFRSGDTVFDAKGLKKVKVQAKVLGHERGPKIRVFKFKPKRGYKRTTGHRQELTRLEVTKVSNGS